jgi:hypothetical protein
VKSPAHLAGSVAAAVREIMLRDLTTREITSGRGRSANAGEAPFRSPRTAIFSLG